MLRALPLLLSGAAVAVLAACTGVSTAQVTAVATDAAAVAADMQSLVSTAKTQGTLSPTEVAAVQAAISKVTTDVAALKTGSSSTTAAQVLADVNTAISVAEPFLPMIGSLVGHPVATMGATPASAALATAMVPLKFDYDHLKFDVDNIKAAGAASAL